MRPVRALPQQPADTLQPFDTAKACRNREAMEAEIEQHKPTRGLCAAGLTGRPNVDWCESNQVSRSLVPPPTPPLVSLR